jgi:hypothetical protein
VERDVRLLADHPAVVSGRCIEEVAGFRDDLLSILYRYDGLSREDEPDVLDLTQAFSAGGADVL